jgi:hypothetical protein
MKVFIRTIDPTINLHTGERLPGGRLLSCAREWVAFQSLLKECLRELGHTVVEQPSSPLVGDEDEGVDFRIYAHKTRRDIAGDLYYNQVHLRNLFTLDGQGWGADHSAAGKPDAFDRVDPRAAAQFCTALRDEMLASGLSKHPQPDRSRVPAEALPEGYAFVPLQRPHDYVQIHHAPISVVDFVDVLADWAESRRQPVAIKPHPFNERDPEVLQALERRSRGSRFVLRVDENVHDLVARATAVVTINSGVGFESLIHGKPVVTFGRSDYAHLTYRATAGRLDEAWRYAAEYTEVQRQRAWQFLYHYFFEHGYYLSESTLADCRRRLLAYLASRAGLGARAGFAATSGPSAPFSQGPPPRSGG